MARYSVLRLMIFFGLLCALWLLGLRTWLLLGVAALGSMVVSYFVLRGPRAQFSANIVHHLDDRAERAQQARPHEIDEHVEDSEASGGPRA
jgi:Protein of unknown function (DUF4229)